MGARSVEPNTPPWLHLLEGWVLAVHQGHAALHPRKAATVIVAWHESAFYEQHYALRDSSSSSTALIDAIESATISTRAVQVIMLHRLRSVESHPLGYGGVVCPYCHLAPSDITSHLLRYCPEFYLQRLKRGTCCTTTVWPCYCAHEPLPHYSLRISGLGHRRYKSASSPAYPNHP